MTKPITITVKGNDVEGSDAPTVEDLLAQIEDLVGVLKAVEEAVADDGKREIQWKVTNVTRNSPLRFEITPFPKTFAMNIDRRAERVVASAATGIRSLSDNGLRPKFFNDETVLLAEKVFGRVASTLAATDIDFSNYDNAPKIEITKEIGKNAVANIASKRSPKTIPHRELGSLEGTITKVELDYLKRPIVWVKARIDGSLIKCIAKDGALDRIGHFEVSQVLRGMRVTMFGLIYYKDLEEISYLEVDGVHVFADDNDLPDFLEIVSPGFTGGVESSAFLEALREDG